VGQRARQTYYDRLKMQTCHHLGALTVFPLKKVGQRQVVAPLHVQFCTIQFMTDSAGLANERNAESLALPLGSRIVVGDKYLATVRYIGPVDGQSGEWAGLEWDDPTRGKHDGSTGGRRYFQCPANAGSFVRIPKLLQSVDVGRTVMDAATERYSVFCNAAAAGPSGSGDNGSASTPAASDSELFIETANGQKLPIGFPTKPAEESSAAAVPLLRASLVGMRVARLVRSSVFPFSIFHFAVLL
jgi:hypothetical protein